MRHDDFHVHPHVPQRADDALDRYVDPYTHSIVCASSLRTAINYNTTEKGQAAREVAHAVTKWFVDRHPDRRYNGYAESCSCDRWSSLPPSNPNACWRGENHSNARCVHAAGDGSSDDVSDS